LQDRPELTRGAVEFVASTEYMVRPPQPPGIKKERERERERERKKERERERERKREREREREYG